MEDMNFRAFLHAQGMLNTYPPQTLLQPGLYRRSPAPTNPFVPYAPQQYRSMMTSPGTHHSFFADAMFHYRDEQTVYEETLRRPLVGHPAVPNFGFRPLLPTAPASMLPTTAPPAFARRVDNMAPLVIPGVLGSHVDQSQYSPVFDDDWTRASFDYDAASPDSVDTQMTSPITPGIDGNNFFGEQVYGNDHCGEDVGVTFIKSEPLPDDTFAAAFATKQYDVAFFTPAIYPATIPNTYTSLNHHVPVHHNTAFPAPYLYDGLMMPDSMMGLRADNMGPARPHHNMPLIEPHPVFRYQPNYLSDDDAQEAEQSPEANGEAPALSDTDDHQSPRSSNAADHNSPVMGILHNQVDKDGFLLSMRRRGISYREIKRRGRYREAESTLRGRYRVLTKDPSERVRKPEWTAHDVSQTSKSIHNLSDFS